VQVAIEEQRTINGLRCVTAVFGLCLFAATRGLWWPVGEYPVIPWVNLRCPFALDHALASAVVLSWVMTLVAIGFGWHSLIRASSLIGIASLAGCMVLDQQRLQVWAWEFLWLQLFLTLASPRVAILSSRLLVTGIYFYSAVSKLDAGFTQTQGPWLWQGLCRAMSIETSAWGKANPTAFLIFPLGELLVAAALVFRRWRRWGIALSVVMHVALLLALGPWGWQQRPGVLLWNLYFLSSIPLLFWRVETDSQNGNSGAVAAETGWRFSNELCLTAAIALGIWPALEGVQLCDHWPAWAVYSSRPEIVRIDVQNHQVARLPQELQRHVGPAEALSDWRPISIDQWSFEMRGSPMYPQGRYRLAIARTLESRYGVQLRVTEQATPSRWTAQRQLREVSDLAQECESRFWFPTTARDRAAEVPAPPRGSLAIALTAQFSVACYVLSLLIAAMRHGDRPTQSEAVLWSLGLAGLVAHVVAAFHFLHHWDHSSALQHTAQRTAEVTGWKWSGGLYINYLFLAFWLQDTIRIWREVCQLRAPAGRTWRRVVQAGFAFMMFNATVVFGPVHWIVVGIAFALLYAVLWQSRRDGRV
jgi:hypothetical protein